MVFTIINVINILVRIYTGIILIYCIMTWIPGSRGYGMLSDIFRVLSKIVDPFLNIFKKIIPPIGGTIDISPIIAIIVLQLIVRLVTSFIFMI